MGTGAAGAWVRLGSEIWPRMLPAHCTANVCRNRKLILSPNRRQDDDDREGPEGGGGPSAKAKTPATMAELNYSQINCKNSAGAVCRQGGGGGIVG